MPSLRPVKPSRSVVVALTPHALGLYLERLGDIYSHLFLIWGKLGRLRGDYAVQIYN